MKLAKEADLKLDDDPREIRDPELFNRLRRGVEAEVIHPDWVSVLGRLERKKIITREQKMACDRYREKYRDFFRWHMVDPEEFRVDARDLIGRRIEKHKREWNKIWSIVGNAFGAKGRAIIHSVIIEDCWPAGYSTIQQSLERRTNFGFESERQILVNGAQFLVDFFSGRNKK